MASHGVIGKFEENARRPALGAQIAGEAAVWSAHADVVDLYGPPVRVHGGDLVARASVLAADDEARLWELVWAAWV